MTRSGPLYRRRRLAIALGFALALCLPAGLVPAAGTGPALAAGELTFSAPTASGSLGTPVRFSDTFTAPSRPARVDVLLDFPGGTPTLVSEADVSGSAGSFTASLAEDDHILPNTTIQYRFRAEGTDGHATVGPRGAITIADGRFDWKTLTGQHVRLHWYEGDAAFGKRALQVGDDAVARVSKLLGVTESQPIDFFVYGSQEALDGALGPGTSEFVAGQAAPDIRTLFAEIDPDQIGSDWVTTVVPHELTHLVFDTATHNLIHQPPLWLNEGLAVYEAEGYDTADRQRVEAGVAGNSIIPLDGLEGPFPERQELFYLSYAEAVSAVDFFVRTYGQDHLVQLVRSYGKGLGDAEAFEAATGADMGAFGRRWLASIHAVPRAYGPQPAPPGVAPPGWTGAGAGMAAGTPKPGTGPLGTPTTGPGAPSAGTGGADRGSPIDLDVLGSAAVLGLLLLGGIWLVLRERRAARR